VEDEMDGEPMDLALKLNDEAVLKRLSVELKDSRIRVQLVPPVKSGEKRPDWWVLVCGILRVKVGSVMWCEAWRRAKGEEWSQSQLYRDLLAWRTDASRTVAPVEEVVAELPGPGEPDARVPTLPERLTLAVEDEILRVAPNLWNILYADKAAEGAKAELHEAILNRVRCVLMS
jgi:hypothetical protein